MIFMKRFITITLIFTLLISMTIPVFADTDWKNSIKYNSYKLEDVKKMAQMRAENIFYCSKGISENPKEAELGVIIANLHNYKVVQPAFESFLKSNPKINWKQFQTEVNAEVKKIRIDEKDKKFIMDSTLTDITVDKLYTLISAYGNNDFSRVKSIETDKDVKAVLDRYFPTVIKEAK